MNPSDWIKAATLITQQKQEAATADTDQLSSMPLSQVAMDDSGPPVMHYGMHVLQQQVHQHIWRWIHISHSRKILISKQYQVYLRVHYTLLWPHLALKKEPLQRKHKHFVIKYPKVWRNIYKTLSNVKP